MMSHTYCEDIEITVAEAIPGFLEEVAYLRERLRE